MTEASFSKVFSPSEFSSLIDILNSILFVSAQRKKIAAVSLWVSLNIENELFVPKEIVFFFSFSNFQFPEFYSIRDNILKIVIIHWKLVLNVFVL